MLKNDKVSRRNFLKKSGAGAGIIGLGVTSSNFFQENAKTDSSQFRQEKISPRDVRVMSMVKSS